MYPPIKLSNVRSNRELEGAKLLRTPSKPKGDMRSKALSNVRKSITA